jgi:carbamate kinase
VEVIILKVVVALGGNALQADGMPATAEAQLQVIKDTVIHLVDMIENGHQIIIVHGNGPQVGRLVIQNEYASEVTPAMPFDVCGAMSQGLIGYHIQQALKDELRRRGINKSTASIITQVVVDKNDKGFTHPTKPIGPFYSEEEAKKIREEKGYIMVEDAGRGYRRVVASPQPERIVEIDTVKTLVDAGQVIITAGGGGVPVIENNDKSLQGVAAVIDKDLASEKLAEDLDAEALMILTAVDRVAINFGKSNQKDLATMSIKEAKEYMEQGQFAPGSMLPKVKAAIKFAESKPGRKCLIASLSKAKQALAGESGTIVMQ